MLTKRIDLVPWVAACGDLSRWVVPLRINGIFQPHVPSEPSTGAVFGQAAYTNDGMGIVFTAATEGKDGNFVYNVYQMSDVTGGDLVQLTHRSGMIDEMSVGRDGTIFFSGGGQRYCLDPHTRLLQAIPK